MKTTRTVAAAVFCGWLMAITSMVPNATAERTATTTGIQLSAGAATNVLASAGVEPQNSLQNGSFELGGETMSPWIFRHDVAATLAVDTAIFADGTRAAKVTIAATSTATHLVQLRQEGLGMQAGTAYTVAFWAKASTVRVINARLQSPVAPYPTFGAADFTVGTSWQRLEFTYTSPTSVPDAFVGFNLAQATGDVWLDDVVMYTNLVSNGGFETGGASLAPWSWRNDTDASRTQDTTVRYAGTASAKITVPTAGAASHLVQLRAPIAPLQARHTYVVSFVMKASKLRGANVRLQGFVAPYPTVAANTFEVTTTWTRVSFQWTPKVDVSDAFLGFNLAQDTGTVWLDDVILTELPAGTITTIAGGGNGDGSPATNASLPDITGVTVDQAGNLYIANEDRIRKVLASGKISTFSGIPDAGSVVTESRLGAAALAFDAAGNLYLADGFHAQVRKVSASGTLSVIAGTGTRGFSGDGGPATDADLHSPRGIVVDTAGNIYIADGNNRVRKVTPAGIISTIAGTGSVGFSGDGGPATNASFNDLNDLAVDAAGNLYVDDSGNSRVRKVTPTGMISTFAGGGTAELGDGGPATEVSLNYPTGLAVDTAGNVYVSEYNNSRVRKVSPSGTISTIAGNGTAGFSGDGGPATNAAFFHPQALAIDAAGNIYVNDYENGRIRKVSTAGTISTVAGNGTWNFSGDGGPATGASLDGPYAATMDAAGNLFIAEVNNERVRKVSAAGIISTVAGTGVRGFSGDGGPATSAALNFPAGVAVDTAGNLYIADSHRVRKVTAAGTISTVAGNGSSGYSGDGGPATDAKLSFPRGMAVDPAGNLYIADVYNFRVRKVSPVGTISTVAGNGIGAFSGDGGSATSASLNTPTSVTIDAAGNLYIADSENARVRKVSPLGTISTVAGNGIGAFSGDGGPATSASLNTPISVTIDAAGNLYIADYDNARVRKVSPVGTISTVAGNGTVAFSGDGGPATDATLAFPNGVAVDGIGNLYVNDAGITRVRKVSAV